MYVWLLIRVRRNHFNSFNICTDSLADSPVLQTIHQTLQRRLQSIQIFRTKKVKLASLELHWHSKFSRTRRTLGQNKIKFKSKLKMWYHTTDYTGGIKVTEDGSLGGFGNLRAFVQYFSEKKNKISSSYPSTPEEDWSEQKFVFLPLASTDGRVRSKRSLLLHERNIYTRTIALFLLASS